MSKTTEKISSKGTDSQRMLLEKDTTRCLFLQNHPVPSEDECYSQASCLPALSFSQHATLLKTTILCLHAVYGHTTLKVCLSSQCATPHTLCRVRKKVHFVALPTTVSKKRTVLSQVRKSIKKQEKDCFVRVFTEAWMSRTCFCCGSLCERCKEVGQPRRVNMTSKD